MTLTSSTSPSARREQLSLPPPSTNSLLTPISYRVSRAFPRSSLSFPPFMIKMPAFLCSASLSSSHSSVTTALFPGTLKALWLRGTLSFGSTITRRGELPRAFLTVRRGLSSRAVFAPTITASLMLLILWSSLISPSQPTLLYPDLLASLPSRVAAENMVT
ncbi:MAG: hypothetical protein NZ902_01130 [Acidilobaceae archaeon]|nr:hypothetical protein [Acidilobaceae archaeon]MCX8165429.1 hypothetical protein [Acidilobaceae archaeon]MDW7973856.1 hypothetical protein [Sulfolobales archaeon]